MSARPALRLVDHLVDENGEVQDCPHCQDARAEADVWEQRVLELERKVRRLEEDKGEALRRDKDYLAALGLFDEWRQETGHPKAKFDRNRAALAIRMIRGYRNHREQLSWVIQYGKHFAYVDEKGVRHDSFGLLFRDAEHIERYANAWARRRHEIGGHDAG